MSEHLPQDSDFAEQVIDLAAMTLVAVAGPDAADCLRCGFCTVGSSILTLYNVEP